MMDKPSLSIHRRKVFASGVLVAVIASLVLVPYFANTRAPPAVTLFEFRAKWICNPSDPAGNVVPNAAEFIGLVSGEYKTDINVHNPSHSVNITIVKKFVISVPERQEPVTPRTVFVKTILLPDGAFFIDCSEITQALGIPPFGVAAKGFVVLGALSSAGTPTGFSSPNSLDVVAEYSAESFAPTTGTPTNSCSAIFPPPPPGPVPCSSTGVSLDVEPIPAAPFVP